MRLTQTAEYAMRAVAYMASQPDDVSHRTQDLSKIAEIPSHYLSKIMRRLVTGGILLSQKGHGGGFTFAQPLDKIRFIDILNAVDYEVDSTVCMFGWGLCNQDEPCPLHGFWAVLKEHFKDWAERYTLKDVRELGGLPLGYGPMLRPETAK